MKKKILALTIAGTVLAAGVVSAASMWGTYKGNDIIRLIVGGAPVKVSDVPVINYNGRTMVPINLLQQAGVTYTWDAKNKTVDINEPQKEVVVKKVGLDWKTIFKHLKPYNVNALSIGITDRLDTITADYNGFTESITEQEYNEILITLAYSDASYFQNIFNDGSNYTYTSSIVRSFYEGKITEKQLQDSMTIITK